MIKTKIALAFVIIFLLSITVVIAATPGQSIAVQGMLKKQSGVPVDTGQYDIRFRIYNSTSGEPATCVAPCLYEKAATNIYVKDGVFSVLLDNINLPFDQQYWLGIRVTKAKGVAVTDTEMTPRSALTFSPYSFVANSLMPGNPLIINSASDSSVLGQGKVGIGTTNPGAQLDVNSACGIAGCSAIRANYSAGGGLANTEFAALAHRNSNWTALYARQGSASSAALFDGRIKITGGSPADGKVLTSDATGLASWQTPSSAGIGGSGTAGRIAKFTAATTLGDSRLADVGSYGVGNVLESTYAQTELRTWGLISPGTMYIEPGADSYLYIVPQDWTNNLNVKIQGSVNIANWASQSLATDGYARVGPLLIQWGKASFYGKEGTFYVNYPIAFSNIFNVQCTELQTTADNVWDTWCNVVADGTTTSQARLYLQYPSAGGGFWDKWHYFYWYAIGT